MNREEQKFESGLCFQLLANIYKKLANRLHRKGSRSSQFGLPRKSKAGQHLESSHLFYFSKSD